jgi:hypothetical protein
MSSSTVKFLFIAGAIFGLLLASACRVFSGLGRAATGKGRIEGTVRDEQRRPLAEVVIVITATTASEPYPEIAPVTNAKGEFGFPELPTGQYTLRAAREGFKEQTQVVTVKEGQTARVEFVLRR